MHPLELLSPARTVDVALEAIRHGADAVYLGGPSFGARAAAGNDIEDIARLCDTAHLYGVRVYVTLNTILYDSELPAAEALTWQLWRAGVDALIVQDLSLLRLNLPPIALHASTQMDNCTPEKARWLEAAGFRQIVLARELSLSEIRAITAAVKVPVEVFVHGALCVSYSGRCYASQHCFGRSANRGNCAQFCRLAFDLVDADGRTLAHDRHFLSLRDMSRLNSLEELVDAGVSSFKIEGRLKDSEYVKNVTAAYRRRLDALIAKRPDELCKGSDGIIRLGFTPDVSRTFNRGFTDYFLHGRPRGPLANLATPKAIGSPIGMATRVSPRGFTLRPLPGVEDAAPVVAGDGLCYIDRREGTLQGFRANRVEGARIVPASPLTGLAEGDKIYRSLDFAMKKVLAAERTERKLPCSLSLSETPRGYAIALTDEHGLTATLAYDAPHETAQSPQAERQRQTLSKTGDTPLLITEVTLKLEGERFIPASSLAQWRREVCDALLRDRRIRYRRDTPGRMDAKALDALTPEQLDYTANVANREARTFYRDHGARRIDDAMETTAEAHPVTADGTEVLMTCRHCIRRDLGICLQEKDTRHRAPLALRLPDSRTFPLRFDCKRCEMQVLAPEESARKKQ